METPRLKIGVLAIQGDFDAHVRVLKGLGVEAVEVRTGDELAQVDGLIIPGGESTTMMKLLGEENLLDPLRRFGAAKPVFGTCAGAILLAKGVMNPAQEALGLMDFSVQRNAYGRQIDSRIVSLVLDGGPLEAVFIRAPIITTVGEKVRVLASYQSDPVLVEQGKHLAATFHPELAADSRVHDHFVEKVAAALGTERTEVPA